MIHPELPTHSISAPHPSSLGGEGGSFHRPEDPSPAPARRLPTAQADRMSWGLGAPGMTRGGSCLAGHCVPVSLCPCSAWNLLGGWAEQHTRKGLVSTPGCVQWRRWAGPRPQNCREQVEQPSFHLQANTEKGTGVGPPPWIQQDGTATPPGSSAPSPPWTWACSRVPTNRQATNKEGEERALGAHGASGQPGRQTPES